MPVRHGYLIPCEAVSGCADLPFWSNRRKKLGRRKAHPDSGGARIETIFDRSTTLRIGQTLELASNVTTVHGATARHTHAADSSAVAFRRFAKRNMRDGNNVVAINYRRNLAGQPPGAHCSPLGADDVVIMPPVFRLAAIARAVRDQGIRQACDAAGAGLHFGGDVGGLRLLGQAGAE